jgi:SAM-dependent methyltransferase
MDASIRNSRDYWDAIAPDYEQRVHIRLDDFHYGPLVPGDSALGLLPNEISGARCLEIGCGAAQNSICLAGRGARCQALDVSEALLARGRSLATEKGVEVTFLHHPMESLESVAPGPFDLAHSVYALPFTDQPDDVIRQAAAALAPGGQFLLSTVHPLFNHEWLEIDGEGMGLWVRDYFTPPAELDSSDGSAVVSRAWTIEDLTAWTHDAGLVIRRILEPRALPVGDMRPEEIARNVPYWSPEWLELAPKLSRIPPCVIIDAVKLPTTAPE